MRYVIFVAAALVVAQPAPAETAADVRALAERAATDARALEQLRDVRTIDGTPVDLRAVLDAEGRDLERRLDELASSLSAPRATVDAEEAAADARAVLDDRRYRGSDVPRPFRGALEWLGDKLSPLGRPVRWLGDRVPGGDATVWTILGLVAIAVAAYVVARVARRRGGMLSERAHRARFASGESPDALERAAVDAERAGELERALRLRFRAGIIRLARRGLLERPEAMTSGDIRRSLGLDDFDRLAHTFDEVVYGGRRAVHDDVADARDRWPRVLEQAVAR